MVGNKELEILRLRKELIAVESDILRHRLRDDAVKLVSPDFWLANAFDSARRHPALTTAVSLGMGVASLNMLRRPGRAIGWLGRLGSLGLLGLRFWRKFGRS